MRRIRSHFELEVYQNARAIAIKVSGIVNNLPTNERFDMVQQWRRCARGVCGFIAEAWRKRRYPSAFVAKLNDAEAEAAESQTWADLAEAEGYTNKSMRDEIVAEYDVVLGQLVVMASQAAKWTVGDRTQPPPVAQSASLPVP